MGCASSAPAVEPERAVEATVEQSAPREVHLNDAFARAENAGSPDVASASGVERESEEGAWDDWDAPARGARASVGGRSGNRSRSARAAEASPGKSRSARNLGEAPRAVYSPKRGELTTYSAEGVTRSSSDVARWATEELARDDAAGRGKVRRDGSLPPVGNSVGGGQGLKRSKVASVDFNDGSVRGGTALTKGQTWAPPTKASALVAQARTRALHKRTMSEEPSGIFASFDRTPVRTASESIPELILELDRRPLFTPDEFLREMETVIGAMRERHEFVRQLTVRTIELCRGMVELEAPIEAMFRLENVGTYASRDKTADPYVDDELFSCKSEDGAFSSSTHEDVGFEISRTLRPSSAMVSNVSTASPPRRRHSDAHPRDISIDDLEAELRDVRALVFGDRIDSTQLD